VFGVLVVVLCPDEPQFADMDMGRETTFLLLFETKQHVSILDTVIFVAEGFKLKFPSGLKCLHAGSCDAPCSVPVPIDSNASI